jgi:hypothetical protein
MPIFDCLECPTVFELELVPWKWPCECKGPIDLPWEARFLYCIVGLLLNLLLHVLDSCSSGNWRYLRETVEDDQNTKKLIAIAIDNIDIQ